MPRRIQMCRDALSELGWEVSDQARSAGWQVVACRNGTSLVFICTDLYTAWSNTLRRAQAIENSGTPAQK